MPIRPSRPWLGATRGFDAPYGDRTEHRWWRLLTPRTQAHLKYRSRLVERRVRVKYDLAVRRGGAVGLEHARET